MKVTILPFGRIADHLSVMELDIPEGMTTGALKAYLFSEHQSLNTLSFSIAVDKKIREDDFVIHAPCDIALLPPFSGG
jgi:molybdopterin synthase sulfur carrier subunit